MVENIGKKIFGEDFTFKKNTNNPLEIAHDNSPKAETNLESSFHPEKVPEKKEKRKKRKERDYGFSVGTDKEEDHCVYGDKFNSITLLFINNYVKY